MRARHGDAQRRARPRRRASRGSASVEYGLLVGLIGAVLCLGIGVAVKSVLQDPFECLIAQMQGRSAPGCGDGGGVDGGGGTGGSGGTGGTSSSPTGSPTESPTPTPTPTASASPTVQPTT